MYMRMKGEEVIPESGAWGTNSTSDGHQPCPQEGTSSNLSSGVPPIFKSPEEGFLN